MTADPIVATVFVEAPPERVYQYFTQPEAMVRWMGEYALLEPEPNGRFVVDVQGAPVRGRFLELDPPHGLVISWGYAGSERLPPGTSTVHVLLTAEGDGTRVELWHRDVPIEETRGHRVGWSHYLPRLRIAAAGGTPASDPGMPSIARE